MTWLPVAGSRPTLHRWAHGVTLCGIRAADRPPGPGAPGRACGACARSLSLTEQRVARRDRHRAIAAAVARMTAAVEHALAGWTRGDA